MMAAPNFFAAEIVRQDVQAVPTLQDALGLQIMQIVMNFDK